MLVLLSEHHRSQAISVYRAYIAVFQQSGHISGAMLHRSEVLLIAAVKARLAQPPTRVQLLEEYRQLIEAVEAEFADGPLPPRPHGL